MSVPQIMPVGDWGKGTYRNIDVFGPFVIGNIFACFFLGVLSVSTWFYFLYRKGDGLLNKIVVTILLVLCTADAVGGCIRTVRICVLDGASFVKLIDLRGRHEENVQYMTTHLACVAAQLFLSFRGVSFIWAMRVTYGRFLRWALLSITVLLGLGLVAVLGFAIGSQIYYLRFTSYLQFVDWKLQYFGTWATVYNTHLSLMAVVDVLLTLILSIGFRHARTGFAESNVFIDSVVTITIRNGMLLTVCQIVQLVLSHLGYVSWTLLIFSFLGQLYAMTVITFLCGPKLKQAEWQDRQDLEAANVDTSARPSLILNQAKQHGGHSGPISDSRSESAGVSTATMIASISSTARCRACHGTGVGGPSWGQHHTLGSPMLSVGVGTPPASYSGRMKDDGGVVGLRAALLDLDEQSDEPHELDEKAESEAGSSPDDLPASAPELSVEDTSTRGFGNGRKDQ